jgi:hypothetical protein
MTTVALPEGKTFPFKATRLKVFVQLAEGIGTFDIGIEMRLILANGGRQIIGRTPTLRLEFPEHERLFTRDVDFDFENVPFRMAGIYEYAAMANHAQCPGATAGSNVLDLEARP